MKVFRVQGCRSSGCFAFTLVELIAAITILALVTGSLYALLRQSVGAAADLQDAEREHQGLRRFMDLCRETLETLPPEATLSLATAEETGTAPELTLTGVPEAFRLGPEPVAASDLIISLRMAATDADSPEASPVYEVAISREEFAPEVESGEFQVRAGSEDEFYQADDQGRFWLPLLTGVRSLEWRYWNEEEELWEEDWTEAPGRPSLVEMQLWPESRPAPYRAVFALPASLPAAKPASPATGASAAGRSGTEGAALPRGGGGPPVPGGRPGGDGPGGGLGPGGWPGGPGGPGGGPGGPGRPGGPPQGGPPNPGSPGPIAPRP